VPNSLVSEFTTWKLNQLNSENIIKDLIPSFSFANPLYIVGTTEEDFLSVPTLYINGQVNQNVVSYTLSTTEPVIDNAQINASELLNSYIDKYSLYLAYKLFEISAGVSPSNSYNGEIENITILSFLPLIPQYLSNGGMLGFIEHYKTPAVGEFTYVENVVDMIYTNVVNVENTNIETNIQNIVNTWLSQYVVTIENVATLASQTTQNATLLFPITPNIEWEDVLSSTLFANKGECFVYDYENIVDIVFMVNPELDTTKYFSEIIMPFLSSTNTIDLKTYFRFVQAGEEKIFDLFDYTKKSDSIISGGIEIDMSNTFLGTITTHNPDEEVTAEYLDENTMYINNKTAPQANTFKNYELLIDGFENNLASDYKQSLNKVTNKGIYSYDSTKNAIFYNETSTECDFIELSLVASNESGKINYAFLFSSFALADKEG